MIWCNTFFIDENTFQFIRTYTDKPNILLIIILYYSTEYCLRMCREKL